MKRKIHACLIIMVLLFTTNIINGQSSNLVFFTPHGEGFSVVINGALQNSEPGMDFRITDITSSSCRLKITFEDRAIGPVYKSLRIKPGTQTTYSIRKGKNGNFGITIMDQVNLAEAPPPPEDQIVIRYSGIQAVQAIQNHNGATMTTSSPTSFSSSPAESSGMPAVTNEHTSEGHEINPQNTWNPRKRHYNMPGYYGQVGCPYPMSDLDFRDVKRSISEKPFEEGKLALAKQVTSANCLFSYEVREIMDLFHFESTRLEFARFAYSYTFDLGNYYKVNDGFKFGSSIEELNKYIKAANNR